MGMGSVSKLAAICAGLVALVGITSAVRAQTVTMPTPPIHSAIDANGVDLQTGFISLTESDLSIGDPGNGGLAYTRRWLVEVQAGTGSTDGHGTNAGWRHNYVMTVKLGNYGNKAIVVLGNDGTLTFSRTANNKPWTSDQHTGWSMVQTGSTYVVTGRDGTIYTLKNQPTGVAIGSYYGQVDAVATSIERPDGEIVTLNYNTGNYNYYACSPTPCANYVTYYMTRLISVQNSHGYQIHYDYADQAQNPSSWRADDWANITRVEAINLAYDYCDPFASSCAGSFPSVAYTHTNVDTYKTYTIVTKPGGGTRRYTLLSGCNCIDGDSSLLLAIKDGTSPTDDVIFTYYYDTSNNVRTQRVVNATRNGVTYTYNFNNTDNPSVPYTYVTTNGTMRWRASTNASDGTLHGYDEAHVSHTYFYDQYGRLNSAQNDGLKQFDITYDDRGNITKEAYYNGATNVPLYQASFDTTCANAKTCNQPNSVTDARGNVTAFTYDPTHGGVLTVTSPAAAAGGIQPQTRTSYTQLFAYYKNASGAIVPASTGIYKPTSTSACITAATCAGTAGEVKTTTTYGSTGIANNLLPTTITTAAGDGSVSSTTAVSYDVVGNKVSEDGPLSGNGDTTLWVYNADRQVTQVVGPDPDGAGPLHNRSVKTTYNANGQVTSVSTGTAGADGSGYIELNRADTTYDAYSRKVTATVTAGGSIQSRTDFSYDNLDRPDCVAVRMNPAIFASATTPACTLGAQGAFGPDRITHNVYDAYDRVTKVQTAYGLPYQRDETTTTYWAGNKIASVADAKGNLTTYTYDTSDPFMRLSKTNYPSPTTVGQSSTTDYEQLTYDAAGHVTNKRLRDGKQISYTYDNLNRQVLAHMVNPVDGNDRDIATSYDLLGRVTQVDDGAGKKVSYTYDALGRKLSESPQLTGGSTTYQYDAAGRRTRLTWSDGFYVNYDYDTLGALTAVRENGATSGAGVLASFAYDDQGKVTALTRGNGVNDAYSYDAASRLSGLTITHPSAGNIYGYAYNPAGQLVSRSMSNDAYAFTQAVPVSHNYTVNGLNQYTASGAVVPTYDGRGNMTSAGSITYTYDSKNQLTNFGTNSLGYDAAGRLVTQGTPATRFVYDGSDLIAETDANNVILRRYVHVPGTDNVLVWYEGATTADRRWLAHDERGSTTLITDNYGTSLGINAYDEYGIPQSTNQGRYQYTGQTWLPELGMYHYKARIYSPTFGRFMQTDPTGYDDGPNWYNYVHGDPINGTDPTGNTDFPTAAQIQESIQNQIRNAINNSAAAAVFSAYMQHSQYERYGSLIPDTFNQDTRPSTTSGKPVCELCILAGGVIDGTSPLLPPTGTDQPASPPNSSGIVASVGVAAGLALGLSGTSKGQFYINVGYGIGLPGVSGSIVKTNNTEALAAGWTSSATLALLTESWNPDAQGRGISTPDVGYTRTYGFNLNNSFKVVFGGLLSAVKGIFIF